MPIFRQLQNTCTCRFAWYSLLLVTNLSATTSLQKQERNNKSVSGLYRLFTHDSATGAAIVLRKILITILSVSKRIVLLQWSAAQALQWTFDSCWSVPRSGAGSGLISAPPLSASNQRKNRREVCWSAASQSGCVHLLSIEHARYATKHVRDTDSDFVMKKPSPVLAGSRSEILECCSKLFSFH